MQNSSGRRELDSAIGEAVRVHGHLGPFLVIGVRMGYIAKDLLKSDTKQGAISKVTIRTPMAVPFSCAIDGIQVTTHCTVGNQRLTLQKCDREIRGSFMTENPCRVVDILVKNEVTKQIRKRMAEGAANEELAKEISRLPEDRLFLMKTSDPSEKKTGRTREDLVIAKDRLMSKNMSLCVVKDGKILFESRSHGVGGFLEAVTKHGGRLAGSSVADRIVGKAIAFLCLHFKIVAVYAETLSLPARTLFEKYSFHLEYDNIVKNILDMNRTDLCPFERLVKNLADPSDAYDKIVSRALAENSKSPRMKRD